jgi:hypothetical protein
MDLHEHLRMARSKIKPISKEEKSARMKKAINARWTKYRAEKRKQNPKPHSTSAPRIET